MRQTWKKKLKNSFFRKKDSKTLFVLCLAISIILFAILQFLIIPLVVKTYIFVVGKNITSDDFIKLTNPYTSAVLAFIGGVALWGIQRDVSNKYENKFDLILYISDPIITSTRKTPLSLYENQLSFDIGTAQPHFRYISICAKVSGNTQIVNWRINQQESAISLKPNMDYELILKVYDPITHSQRYASYPIIYVAENEKGMRCEGKYILKVDHQSLKCTLERPDN